MDANAPGGLVRWCGDHKTLGGVFTGSTLMDSCVQVGV